MLLAECARRRRRRAGSRARSTRSRVGAAGFELDDRARRRSSATRLVVATGGLSIPKIGASDWGYGLARQFGHRIVETRPALVPLDLRRRRPGSRFAALAGVALPVRIETGDGAARGRVRRGPALHPPRPERPGGAADLDLLAAGRADRDRPARRASTSAAALRRAPRRRRAASSATCSPSCCRAGSPTPGWRRDRAGLAERPIADLRDRDLAAAGRRRCSAGQLVPGRHRGLPQGRGHGRRRRHPRARLAQLRKPARPGPALHRRGGRRDRLAGRLQLPVGLGQRGRLRPGAGGRELLHRAWRAIIVVFPQFQPRST